MEVSIVGRSFIRAGQVERLTQPRPLTYGDTMSDVLGVDVSHHNGTINWDALKARGIAFAYIKCTESNNFRDPSFLHNYSEARRVGIIPGAYLYFRPEASAASQVAYFRKLYGLWAPGEMPPALDLEEAGIYGAAALVKKADDTLTLMRDTLGRDPMIYTYKWFYISRLGNTAKWAGIYPLWMAQYTNPGPGIPYVGQFPTYSIWQNSAPGTAGPDYAHMDHNIWHGDIAGLRRMAGL